MASKKNPTLADVVKQSGITRFAVVRVVECLKYYSHPQIEIIIDEACKEVDQLGGAAPAKELRVTKKSRKVDDSGKEKKKMS